jgi:aspartyl-tRNA(Asn)/glutamyl-tRNA(Gln) amidotransferase subunit A
MHNLTITELIDGLKNRVFSSTEITQHFLARIRNLDSEFNSLITLTENQALKAAKTADQLIAAGNAPELCGVPIVHKDIFCTEGVRTSCGSKMLDNFVPPYNATVVENFRSSGAVMLGKTNMDEFAMGSSNETSFYGPVKNPWSTDSVPGGSSGGSAAAIAARLAPTYGRVSRWGMIAFASSLDQGGPMARTAEDCALLLNCMASYDDKDSTCIDRPVPNYSAHLGDSLKGLRIGIPKEYFSEGLNSGTEQAVRASLAEYEKLGAKLVEISLPNTGLSVPAYYVIAPAESSANLSRFDGVRYGHRCNDPKDLEDLYRRTRAEGFGDEVQRRILIGTYCLSAGYYDAYYGKAQQVRQLIRQDFIQAFEKVDLIMGPTCPSPAFKFGAKGNDPVAMYLEDIYTISTNLAGLPGMSLPCGMVDNKPVGLQIIGNYFDEARMLNAAHQFQQVTDWHQLAPAGIE